MQEETSILRTFQKELNLADDQLRQLQKTYFTGGLSFVDAFEDIGVTDEVRVLKVLAEHLQLPLLGREDYPEKPVLLEGVSMFFLRKHAVLPIQVDAGRVKVVVNSPLDIPLFATRSLWATLRNVRVRMTEL